MATQKRKREGIMLCYPYEAKRLTKYKSVALQPKLDGVRAIWKDGKLLSSTGLEYTSVPHITSVLSSFDQVNLDGELYVHGWKTEKINGCARLIEPSDDSAKLEYHIFDCFGEELTDKRFEKRWLRLFWYERQYINVVPSHFPQFKNLDELENIINKYISECMQSGYEGIIIRDGEGPYEFKRTTRMMKLKPRNSDSYKIVRFEEEFSIEDEPKNALGAIWCQDERGEEFKVGTGSLFTRENRESLWKERESLVGKTLVIKYQDLTSDRKVPRFPAAISIED